jgi:hypothetical protein
MTKNNPTPGNAPAMSDQAGEKIEKAIDLVYRAIDLMQCIEMTQLYATTDEGEAISTVAFIAREKMIEAKALMIDSFKAEAVTS